MKKKINFGVYIANFGIFDSPTDYLDLAILAEQKNWDGFFLWDHTVGQRGIPASESFTTLSAIAAKTHSIKIGTTVTGLPRHKPWLLARQIATIDHISKGRFTLGIGLGGPEEYSTFNEENQPIILKEKLEESLEIIQGLFTQKQFSYQGKHYQIKNFGFQPKPIQNPLPIWVGGGWPHKAPMKRAARYQGVFPINGVSDDGLTSNDVKDILDYIKKYRDSLEEFDVVIFVYTTGKKEDDDWAKEYIDVGVNWLVEVIYPGRGSKEDIFNRIQIGPPTYLVNS